MNFTDYKTLADAVTAWKEEQDDEGYTGAVSDLLSNGCVSGMVSGLIYYTETGAFFEHFRREIEAMYTEALSDYGPDFKLNGWDDEDPFCRDTTNQNLMAWFGFEQTADQLFEEMKLTQHDIDHIEAEHADMLANDTEAEPYDGPEDIMLSTGYARLWIDGEVTQYGAVIYTVDA